MHESPTLSGLPHPALYIHVPFCRHRCGYCNFSLVAGRDDLIERFLAALEAEIRMRSQRQQVSTLFLGGGTPSHLGDQHLRRLFEVVEQNFELSSTSSGGAAEVTVECNPSDIDERKIATFADLGVNRISLGAQSFDAAKLRMLERDHDAEQIARAVKLCGELTGNISLDLIFGVDNESLDAWHADLRQAIGLQPTHLSTYQLTIEKGTAFWSRHQKQELRQPGESRSADMYESTIGALESDGYKQYEISSFAKPGSECRHNLAYWRGHEYLAFGPGAASYVDSVREINHRSTTTYINRIEAGESPVIESEKVEAWLEPVEFIVFGLRAIAGVSTSEFQQRFGHDLIEFLGPTWEQLENERLLECTAGKIRLTSAGVLMYDSIASYIYVGNAR